MVRHLRLEGVRMSRLMRLMGLQAIYRAPRTSYPEHRVYPYLLKDMSINRSNQVWCADITYIRLPLPGGGQPTFTPSPLGSAISCPLYAHISFNYSRLGPAPHRFRQAISVSYMVNVGLIVYEATKTSFGPADLKNSSARSLSFKDSKNSVQ